MFSFLLIFSVSCWSVEVNARALFVADQWTTVIRDGSETSTRATTMLLALLLHDLAFYVMCLIWLNYILI